MNFFLTMTEIIISKNIDLFFWTTLYGIQINSAC